MIQYREFIGKDGGVHHLKVPDNGQSPRMYIGREKDLIGKCYFSIVDEESYLITGEIKKDKKNWFGTSKEPTLKIEQNGREKESPLSKHLDDIELVDLGDK